MKPATNGLTILAACVAGCVLIISACAPHLYVDTPPAAAAKAVTWSADDYAAMSGRGEKVFATECRRCHTVDGVANTAGPDLSDYGSEGWSHIRTADFVRDPQRYYPGTKMTSFGEGFAKKKEETLTGSQIDDVTAYIRSLKKMATYLPKAEAVEKTSK